MHPEKLREYAEKLREYAEKLREKIARKGGEIAGIHTRNNVPTMQEKSGNVSKIHSNLWTACATCEKMLQSH